MNQHSAAQKSLVIFVVLVILLAFSSATYAISLENMGTLSKDGRVVTVNSESTPVDRDSIVQKMERGQLSGSAAFYTVDKNGMTGIAIYDCVTD